MAGLQTSRLFCRRVRPGIFVAPHRDGVAVVQVGDVRQDRKDMLPCPRRVTGNHLHGRLATTVERSPTTKRWDALKAADISASDAVATFADPGTLMYPRIETRLVLGRNLSLGCTITFALISFGTGHVPVRGLQLSARLTRMYRCLTTAPIAVEAVPPRWAMSTARSSGAFKSSTGRRRGGRHACEPHADAHDARRHAQLTRGRLRGR